MTTNDALTVILKQFQATGDIEQAKEDINRLYPKVVDGSECFKCEYCNTVMGESECFLKEDEPPQQIYSGQRYICPNGD